MCRLLQSTDHGVATNLIAQEAASLNQLKQLPEMGVAVTAGLTYLKYLSETWMPAPLWHSWSKKGRMEASSILNIPVEGIIPTTNHLESFNSILKTKHIHRWQRSGRRLHLDLFIYLLVAQIVPHIFKHNSSLDEYHCWLSKRFQAETGGVDLVTRHRPAAPLHVTPSAQTIAWWPADGAVQHGDEIAYMVSHSRLMDVRWIDIYTVCGQCASSAANIQLTAYQRYDVQISTQGWASCTCLAFTRNGAACKHLWALRAAIPKLIRAKLLEPPAFAW